MEVEKWKNNFVGNRRDIDRRMNYLSIFFIGLIIQFLVLPIVAQGNSTTKALCYAGTVADIL